MDFLNSIFGSLGETLAKVLPTSPFQEHIANFSQIPYLGWLNWFIPIKACLVVFSTWLVAVGLFYFYSIAMRWVKMIGD